MKNKTKFILSILLITPMIIGGCPKVGVSASGKGGTQNDDDYAGCYQKCSDEAEACVKNGNTQSACWTYGYNNCVNSRCEDKTP